jgi:exodeoxyribonuclease V beta subunit
MTGQGSLPRTAGRSGGDNTMPARAPTAAGQRGRADDRTPAFRLDSPLPEGLVVLEASAGTGKTYTLASLVARYVAEGVPLENILVVTFTRAATGELREAVRRRLRAAADILGATREGMPLLPAGATRTGGAADPRATAPEPSAPFTGDAVRLIDLADPFAHALLAGGEADRAARSTRVRAALAGYDAATITTLHGFCQLMLSSLGVAADAPRNARFLEDSTDLVTEVVDELYIAKYHRSGVGPPPESFTVEAARRIGQAAVTNLDALLEPEAAAVGSAAALRCSFARAVRRRFTERLFAAGQLTYDSLLQRLAQSLGADLERAPAGQLTAGSEPERQSTGPGLAAQRLRDRYHVVLVDEFQDTDPVQWDILRLAFAHHDPDPDPDPATAVPGGPAPAAARGDRRRALVLIGDPKQAIYGFRGADVHAYLAASELGTRQTLTVNWRSDPGLLRAVHAVLGDTPLGDPRITVHPLETAPEVQRHVLSGIPGRAPLRVRILPAPLPTSASRGSSRSPLHPTPAARKAIAMDLAGDIAALLGSGTRLSPPVGPSRALAPGDIAVLVRNHGQARLVQDALVGIGLPAVAASSDSVLETPAAEAWSILLEALDRPSSSRRACSAALTPFFGASPEELARASEDWVEELQATLARWAGLLETIGIAALWELVARERNVASRALAQAGGERLLTDLRHVAQLLQAESAAGRATPGALGGWLREAARGERTAASDNRQRRLESDADAIQVLTIHRSKGLEFPVVYAPFLWDRWTPKRGEVFSFHKDGGGRVLDVGGPPAGRDDPDQAVNWATSVREELGEELRLAYVALTRARHRCVVHWATTRNTPQAALAALVRAGLARLAGDDPGVLGADGPPRSGDSTGPSGRRPPRGASAPAAPSPAQARGFFETLADLLDGDLAVEEVGAQPAAVSLATHQRQGALSRRPFDRRLDVDWRRTSYTGIVRGVGRAGTNEPEHLGKQDELDTTPPLAPTITPAPDTPGRSATSRARNAVPSPWSGIPGGTRLGTLVHALLERLPAPPPRGSELRDAVREAAQALGTEVDPAALAHALEAALTSPLGEHFPYPNLAALPSSRRLSELAFELPLSGGDRPQGNVELCALADLLEDALPRDDPLAGYPSKLREPGLASRLRGYLTGSIDLVASLDDPDRERGASTAFAVVDYKTDRLGLPGRPLTADDYRPEVLAAAMCHGHYPLQGLLYAVALHRYLRWRLPRGPEPEPVRSVTYLFLRGMVGPETPVVDGSPCGVFSWRPPVGLVPALSDLLDRGST